MSRSTAYTAVITGVSGQSVTLSLDEGGEDTILKFRSVSCAVGDLAHIITVGRARYVDGVIGSGTAPVPEPALSVPPPAPGDVATGAWLFGPTDPGTWRNGDWRTDTTLLYQGVYGSGSPQYGAAWYGDGPSALPGDLTAAVVTLCRSQGDYGLQTPTMALYAGTTRPDAKPVVLASEVGPQLERDVPVDWTVPGYWLPLLQDGSAGGIGCYLPSPDPALALTAEGSGMTLTCRWREDPT